MSKQQRPPTPTSPKSAPDEVRLVVAWTLVRQPEGWAYQKLVVPEQAVRIVAASGPDPMGVTLDRVMADMELEFVR